MWLNKLSKRWLGWPATDRRARPQSARPRLELLEDRNLLSVGPLDVVGHLPVAEYNQFIANAVNSDGNAFLDWGNEPSVAVNPKNPSQIVVSTFAYSPDGFVVSGPGATKASLWYSTDGGSNWVIRFPISGSPVPGESVPEDQTFAYDANGVLHGALLSFPDINIYQGSTADPNLDGIDGRPPSVWEWNTNRVNLPRVGLNTADQPWIAVQGNHVYVGYNVNAGDHLGTGGSANVARVSASSDGGATFTSDNAISNGFRATFVNPGVRLATDGAGNLYGSFERADPDLPGFLAGEPQMVHFRLNESSDGGASWKYTHNDAIGGLAIDDGLSHPGGGNALAADPTGAHVYAVYRKEDSSGAERFYLAEFHPDGAGNLVERASPIALSVAGQTAVLPSIAVTDNGTIAVQYDTLPSNDGQYHVHLATSTDKGLTFADQDLHDFTTAGMAGLPTLGGNGRILGDYQYLIALGNTFYGTFAARGNVNDSVTGINTTNKIDPFFYSVTLPGGSLSSLAPSAPSGPTGGSTSTSLTGPARGEALPDGRGVEPATSFAVPSLANALSGPSAPAGLPALPISLGGDSMSSVPGPPFSAPPGRVGADGAPAGVGSAGQDLLPAGSQQSLRPSELSDGPAALGVIFLDAFSPEKAGRCDWAPELVS
jgi:hypothetical protein